MKTKTISALMSLTLAAPFAFAHDGEIFEPGMGQVYSGIGNSKKDADAFEAATPGFRMAHEKLYIGFDSQNPTHPLNPANFLNKLNTIANDGQIPQLGLDFKGFHPSFLPMDHAISLGMEDAFLDLIAGLIKTFDKPIFILPGFEFNLVGYTPGIFPLAFDHIVERFRINGVKNVAWVWNAFIDSSTAPTQYDEKDLSGNYLWLGDPANVNWMAMNIFIADAWIKGSTSGNAVIMNNFIAFAELFNKPILYAETTSLLGQSILPTSDPLAQLQAQFLWANHFGHMFTNINCFDRIKGFLTISTNWSSLGNPLWLTWGDLRIEKNQFLLNLLQAELAKPQYLNGTPGGPTLPHPWIPWTKQVKSNGQNVDLDIFNLPPGSPALLFLSPFVLPDGANIGGVQGDWFLAPPIFYLFTFNAAANGKIQLSIPLPPATPAVTVYLQWVSAAGAPKPMKLVIQ